MAKSSKGKFSKVWMLAQYLNPEYYNWTSTGYSDQRIISGAKKCETANSPYYSKNSKYHYIYECYQHFYFHIVNEFQRKFDDYKAIFSNQLTNEDKAELIGYHLAMRICFYYYMDTYSNAIRYHRKGSKIKLPKPPKIAWVLHDSDKSVNGDIVKPHLHFALRFSKQVKPSQLSKWSGIKPQYFETKRQGRYAFENELAYLIHAKQPQKHQYSPKTVHANFDYMKYYNNHKDRWRIHAGDILKQISQRGAPWLEEQVANNPRMTLQRILLNKPLFNIYVTDIDKIKGIIEAKAERVAAQTEVLIRNHKISLSVIYIWGKSGAGKSVEADRIIRKIHDKHPDWTVYKTAQSSGSSPHPFDNYSGEPIIDFDEARSSDLSAEAWLSLLDALHTNTLSARYHNKHIASRVIIMTTTESPTDFFGFMRGVHADEPLSQFMRRLGIILKVYKLQNGNRVITYQSIFDIGKPMTVVIGKNKNDNVVYKKTSYYPLPSPEGVKLTPKQATEKAVKYINKNNNPGIIHHPGSRPTLPKPKDKNKK